MRRADWDTQRCATARSRTHRASSSERAWPHAIFGVGHTFSNVSDALRRTSEAASVSQARRPGELWVVTPSYRREQVSQLFFLGLQVSRRQRGWRNLDREPLAYRQAF